jgi:asparagine synthase (glutamine-hydrolysing)
MVSYLEIRHYMLCTLLRDTDFMSMAHSIEVRVPLLDHRLAEYVIQLPGNLKLKGSRPKPLLVDALRDTLPPFIQEKSKRAFTFPWEEWLRGPLQKTMQDTLVSQANRIPDVLNSKSLEWVWRSFVSGHTTWARPWALFVLICWMERNGVTS